MNRIISRNKFYFINSFFHLADNSKKAENKIYKANYLYRIIDKFSEVYSPSDKLVIDEAVVPYKGRLSIKQYMPYKPNKWGIKAYVIADSCTGYNLNTIFYHGENTFENKKSNLIGFNVVDKLMSPYFHSNYKVFTDSFYTSYDLVKYMTSRGVGITGTFFHNRSGFPKLTKKLQKHEYATYKNSDCLVTFWSDTVVVNCISNIYSNKPITKTKSFKNSCYTKPEMIEMYSKYMSGVDRHNQMCSFYRFPHKSKKWWKVLLIQTIQMTIVNSYILYREFSENCQKFDHKTFILEIVDSYLKLRSLCEIPRTEILLENKNSKSIDKHFPEVLEDKKRIACKMCKTSNNKRRLVRYRCDICKVGLCIWPCFKKYHS